MVLSIVTIFSLSDVNINRITMQAFVVEENRNAEDSDEELKCLIIVKVVNIFVMLL